jgi:hypothetical protein
MSGMKIASGFLRRAASFASQPRRCITYAYRTDEGRRHVQFHLEPHEQALLGIGGPVIGFRKGGFVLERPMADAVTLHIKRIETPSEVARVKKLIAQLEGSDLDPDNVTAPNCVGAAADLIGAVHNAPSLAPRGRYVRGTELAQHYIRRHDGKESGTPVSPPDVPDVTVVFHVLDGDIADPGAHYPTAQYD